jgi:hypothetical protein
MPTPSLIPPEQFAQVVTAKLKSPVGMTDKAEVSLKVALPRAVIERPMVRALCPT